MFSLKFLKGFFTRVDEIRRIVVVDDFDDDEFPPDDDSDLRRPDGTLFGRPREEIRLDERRQSWF